MAGKVEQFIFTFGDVNKKKTYSFSQDGMMLAFVSLNNDVKDSKMTWVRMRDGLSLFQKTSLPKGVLATAVIDDFGDASSLLLAIESDQRTSRELAEFADKLSARLRTITTMGNIKVVGEETEETSILLDPVKLSRYGVSP